MLEQQLYCCIKHLKRFRIFLFILFTVNLVYQDYTEDYGSMQYAKVFHSPIARKTLEVSLLRQYLS